MECGVELPFERVLLQPGDLVAGRYLILNLLGRGGMGVVAEVEDQEDKQRYALKTLGAEALEQPLWRARFRQEARALSPFHSPHIQRLHRYFEDDGQPYMLMEYVDGTDLQKLLEHCIRLPLELALSAVSQALRGLAEVHKAGIVHRDIKPSNLLVSLDGIVKLSDFGVALLSEGERYTLPGQNLGTTPYLSPEMVRFGEADKLADLYSMGVTLFALLTGQTPFVGEDAEIRRAHLEKPLPELRRWVPHAPPHLPLVLQQVMAKFPAQRYDCADDFREALLTDEAPLRLRWCSLCDHFVLAPLEQLPLVSRPVVPMTEGELSVYCLFCEHRDAINRFDEPDEQHTQESMSVLDSMMSGDHFSQTSYAHISSENLLESVRTEEFPTVQSRSQIRWSGAIFSEQSSSQEAIELTNPSSQGITGTDEPQEASSARSASLSSPESKD